MNSATISLQMIEKHFEAIRKQVEQYKQLKQEDYQFQPLGKRIQ